MPSVKELYGDGSGDGDGDGDGDGAHAVSLRGGWFLSAPR
jgi:hypothetical protein